MQAFNEKIADVYRQTREEFAQRRSEPNYAAYVVPSATDPDPGFAIFYTPPSYEPPLLIIGMNPSNFAGSGASLKAAPNAAMLEGKPPGVNSYLEHNHEFAIALRKGFAKHFNLLEAAVGMNVWYFQGPTWFLALFARRHATVRKVD